MENKQLPKISSAQLVTLLVTSRCLSLLARPSALSKGADVRETLIGLAISVVIFFIIESKPGKILTRNMTISKVSAVPLAALFAVSCVNSVLSYSVFFQTESEVTLPPSVIFIFIMAVILYALYNGIEGIVRFGFVIATFVVIAMGSTILANYGKMSAVNLGIPNTPGVTNIANIIIANTLLCSEIVAYFVLKRYICEEDAHKNGLRTFYVSQTVIIAVAILVCRLVFGSFTRSQRYPLFSLAIVGEFAVVQRLDVIHIAMWLLITTVKLCAFTASILTVISAVAPKIKHNIIISSITAFVVVAAMVMSSVFVTKPEVFECITAVLFVLSAAAAMGGSTKKQLKRKEGTL